MPPNTSLQNYDASLPKLPVPQSQPDWLAVIARMRGMQPADVEQANVLELGCGDGGNLIPLAERYPQGKFVGIDDSARQIATARQEVDALRLGNLELRHESLFDFEAAPGAFDYIIADGVYSWVEPESRDRLLAICRDHLALEGVAFVSYRVHPGWQVHELLGSMMRFEARGSNSVAQQLAAGRMLLDFLRAALPGDDNPYGSLMRSELDGVLRQSDEFLRRNYLQEATGGIYFRQFVAHAKRHALQFLGDCTAGILFGDPLHEAAERAWARLLPIFWKSSKSATSSAIARIARPCCVTIESHCSPRSRPNGCAVCISKDASLRKMRRCRSIRPRSIRLSAPTASACRRACRPPKLRLRTSHSSGPAR